MAVINYAGSDKGSLQDDRDGEEMGAGREREIGKGDKEV